MSRSNSSFNDSSDETAERLRTLLAADPPAAVGALAESDRAALADLIAEARTRQVQSLEASFTATLKHVPFPVRKLVKKALLG